MNNASLTWKLKIIPPCWEDCVLLFGIWRLDLPKELKPLEGGGQQGTMVVVLFGFVLLWVVFLVWELWRLIVSPPLVSEGSNKTLLTHVLGIRKTPIFNFEITPTYIGFCTKKILHLPHWFLNTIQFHQWQCMWKMTRNKIECWT